MGQIKIPLTAGDAVEQENGGMEAGAARSIEDRQQPPALAGNQDAMDVRAIIAGVRMFLK